MLVNLTGRWVGGKVTLTDLGHRTMAAMESDRRQAATQLVAGLSEDEVDRFGRTLATVAERLRHLVDAVP